MEVVAFLLEILKFKKGQNMTHN